MSAPDEFALIRQLVATQRAQRDDVVLGIGDDGAVLAPHRDAHLVAVCDTLIAGRHFPEDTDAFSIGWKSLAVNLSDLAAMGAQPQWALLALTLPHADRDWIERFGSGFGALAKMSGVDLVGGDTTRGALSITVTALGAIAPGFALRRDGARVGDHVCIAGTPGEAAFGLRAVQGGRRDDARFAHCIARLDRPEPQLALGQALVGVASAAIDVSDGLLADLAHIARASQVGMQLELASIPHPPIALARALGGEDSSAIDAALAGGDDYLLAFTVAASALPEAEVRCATLGLGLCRIGVVSSDAGVRVIAADGSEYRVASTGYLHFGEADA